MGNIERPGRFEPGRAEEIRKAAAEVFPDDGKLRLADVVFERAPRKPEGEVGFIVQTARKARRDAYGIAGRYLDLPLVEALVDGGGLAAELAAFREGLLDELAVKEEGVEPDPDEEARRTIEGHGKPGGRNRLGSLIVRDRRLRARLPGG